MKDDLKKFWADIKRNPLLTVTVLLAFAVITSFAFAPTYKGNHLDAAKAGEFGDFVGGYFGPILSLVGIFFVVLTLREQRETTLQERRGDEVSAFENKYYQMLRLHRENVAEMKIGNEIEGRKVFVYMLYECKAALGIITSMNEHQLGWQFTEILQLAYYAVFFGVGGNSSSSLREALKAAGKELDDGLFESLEHNLMEQGLEGLAYVYFQGHQSRLGHYYRHLFQLVSFIDESKLGINKESYVKTVRAQLSTHEQALLLLNSLTSIGWEWWNKDFIKKYGMVKNLPKGFMEGYCSLDVKNLFPDKYFEGEQSTGRPAILEKVRNLN